MHETDTLSLPFGRENTITLVFKSIAGNSFLSKEDSDARELTFLFSRPVYLKSSVGFRLFLACGLDEKGIPYEVCEKR